MESTGPATLRVHGGVELDGLEVVSGAQHLGLDARYDFASGALAANLRAQKLDLKHLVGLIKPSVDLPDTQLAIEAHVRGTRQRPVADLALDGFSVRTPALGLDHITYELRAHYADERVKAEWKLSAIDQSFHGKLDVPTVLTGNRPIMADLSASNIWMIKLHKVLPPRVANVDGRLDASLKASGTTLRPVVAIDICTDAAGRSARTTRTTTCGSRSPTRSACSTRAPRCTSSSRPARTPARWWRSCTCRSTCRRSSSRSSRRLVDRLERKTPIAAMVTLTRLDLARFPFQQLGMEPPATAGLVDGSIKLHGTMRDPTLDVNVEGHQLARGKIDKIDLFASFGYANKQASAKLDASLREAPILRVRGAAPLDVQRLLDGAPYRDTPVRVDVQVPGFNLVRVQDLVPKIEGQVNATGQLRGTLGRPTGTLDLAVAALRLGDMKYDKLEVHGGFDGARLAATLDAHEVKGGTLAAHATVPIDASAPVVAALRASGFYLDVQSAGLTNPRLIKGRVDAQLDVHGPRANPTVQGFVRLNDGELALAADPRIYEGIKIDIAVQNGTATLEDLEAKIQDGTVHATGQAKLAGLKPQSVDLKAEAHRFPIPTGSFGAWLDATVTVHGQRTSNGLEGTVVVDKGTANLPKISTGKKLQRLGPLEDVKFVDARARRQAALRAQAEKEPATTELVAKIAGPFHVRSKEISTDLSGVVQVAIVGPVMRLTGHVHTDGGWFELLGRRYNIDKARVGFNGGSELDPELDVRLTRELSETMLIIEVHGTAKKPTLVLTCDPPIYDQSEVIAAILSGDPATQRVDDRSLDQKVTGAISGLLVGKIKDQIAPNLPIDVIKVDTGTEGSTGLADTRVEIGKYITDTIYVSYVHQFGSTFVGTQQFNTNEADLEWRFKKHYELETAFGDAAVGRVNLYWTIRY